MGRPAHANNCNGRKCRTYTSNIKIKRKGLDPINASHLDEETADVLICICELFVMGYLDVHKIAEIIERKVERSMQRTQDYVKQLEEEAKYNGDF